MEGESLVRDYKGETENSDGPNLYFLLIVHGYYYYLLLLLVIVILLLYTTTESFILRVQFEFGGGRGSKDFFFLYLRWKIQPKFSPG